ncbi:MAG: YqgE/AlgH family protein [Chloroflexota bacterium]
MTQPATDRLAPGTLLVASPTEQHDGTFARSVILLVDCEPNGITTGIVLNRRLPEPAMTTSALALLFVSNPSETAFWGGPMGQDPAILAEFDRPDGLEWFHLPHQQRRPFPLPAIGVVAVAEHPSAFDDRILRARLFVGLAVWGSNGAEREVARGAWYVTPAQPVDIFTTDPDALWEAVVARARGA